MSERRKLCGKASAKELEIWADKTYFGGVTFEYHHLKNFKSIDYNHVSLVDINSVHKYKKRRLISSILTEYDPLHKRKPLNGGSNINLIEECTEVSEKNMITVSSNIIKFQYSSDMIMDHMKKHMSQYVQDQEKQKIDLEDYIPMKRQKFCRVSEEHTPGLTTLNEPRLKNKKMNDFCALQMNNVQSRHTAFSEEKSGSVLKCSVKEGHKSANEDNNLSSSNTSLELNLAPASIIRIDRDDTRVTTNKCSISTGSLKEIEQLVPSKCKKCEDIASTVSSTINSRTETIPETVSVKEIKKASAYKSSVTLECLKDSPENALPGKSDLRERSGKNKLDSHPKEGKTKPNLVSKVKESPVSKTEGKKSNKKISSEIASSKEIISNKIDRCKENKELSKYSNSSCIKDNNHTIKAMDSNEMKKRSNHNNVADKKINSGAKDDHSKNRPNNHAKSKQDTNGTHRNKHDHHNKSKHNNQDKRMYDHNNCKQKSKHYNYNKSKDDNQKKSKNGLSKSKIQQAHETIGICKTDCQRGQNAITSNGIKQVDIYILECLKSDLTDSVIDNSSDSGVNGKKNMIGDDKPIDNIEYHLACLNGVSSENNLTEKDEKISKMPDIQEKSLNNSGSNSSTINNYSNIKRNDDSKKTGEILDTEDLNKTTASVEHEVNQKDVDMSKNKVSIKLEADVVENKMDGDIKPTTNATNFSSRDYGFKHTLEEDLDTIFNAFYKFIKVKNEVNTDDIYYYKDDSAIIVSETNNKVTHFDNLMSKLSRLSRYYNDFADVHSFFCIAYSTKRFFINRCKKIISIDAWRVDQINVLKNDLPKQVEYYVSKGTKILNKIKLLFDSVEWNIGNLNEKIIKPIYNVIALKKMRVTFHSFQTFVLKFNSVQSRDKLINSFKNIDCPILSKYYNLHFHKSSHEENINTRINKNIGPVNCEPTDHLMTYLSPQFLTSDRPNCNILPQMGNYSVSQMSQPEVAAHQFPNQIQIPTSMTQSHLCQPHQPTPPQAYMIGHKENTLMVPLLQQPIVCPQSLQPPSHLQTLPLQSEIGPNQTIPLSSRIISSQSQINHHHHQSQMVPGQSERRLSNLPQWMNVFDVNAHSNNTVMNIFPLKKGNSSAVITPNPQFISSSCIPSFKTPDNVLSYSNQPYFPHPSSTYSSVNSSSSNSSIRPEYYRIEKTTHFADQEPENSDNSLLSQESMNNPINVTYQAYIPKESTHEIERTVCSIPQNNLSQTHYLLSTDKLHVPLKSSVSRPVLSLQDNRNDRPMCFPYQKVNQKQFPQETNYNEGAVEQTNNLQFITTNGKIGRDQYLSTTGELVSLSSYHSDDNAQQLSSSNNSSNMIKKSYHPYKPENEFLNNSISTQENYSIQGGQMSQRRGSNRETEKDQNDNFPCEVCEKPAIFMCSKCCSSAYCSENCAVKDWNEHSQLCQKIVETIRELT